MKYALLALTLLLSACKAPAPSAPAPLQALLPAATGWVDKWIGPEGTFLALSATEGFCRD